MNQEQKTKTSDQQYNIPKNIDIDKNGNVISDIEKKNKQKEEEIKKRKALVREISEKKKTAAKFGIRCAKLGRPKYTTRYEYILGLSEDEEFIDQNILWFDSRSIGSMFSEISYNLYCDGYEYAQKEMYETNLTEVQKRFNDFKFSKHINFIESFIKAVHIILYNSDKLYIKDSVIKLVSWVQWFRYGLTHNFNKVHSQQIITPNALFFFSGIGGTGKGELLKALKNACLELGIAAGNVTTSGLSGKFITSDIKKLQLGIIGEALWQSQRGRDVNIDVINNIIDKIEIDFERKGKQMERLQTNLTIIGGTNNRYLNRRFSLIPFNEIEVNANLKPPEPAKMKQAWIDLITFCPDPKDTWYDVQTMNQKSPQAASEDILSIFDCFYRSGELHFASLSVREIIKKITNKDRESLRDRRFILNALKHLIELKIIKKISPPSNEALIVSKVEIIDNDKFQDIVSQYNPDEAREIKEGRTSKEKVISDIIFELYVQPIKEKLSNKILTLEIDNQKIESEIQTNDKPNTEKILKQLDIQTDIDIYKRILNIIENISIKKDKPPG
ncbi:MAG: hypothetical protein LBD46_07855 [Endomicrobium sp.]|jgi:RNA polymerase-interacting CarD/CdnL/TRCF family regulator|nr:hypothetical protein [Endomicrobium sp.]